jgi:hypothetical protein
MMQTVGIVVAAKLRRSDRGCVLAYVGQVVAAFAGMTEKELLKRFADGGTCLVTIHQGRPLLRGPQFVDWINVKEVHDEVTKAISEIEDRLQHSFGGRPRGLAGASKR